MKGGFLMNDEKSVELYLKRDEKALSETSRRYGSRLRSVSFNIVQNRSTAEECENDTYLEAWESIPPHQPYDYLEQRNIFLRRYWYMDTIREIARHFAISESKTKTMLFRIRKEMKLFLIKEGYDL